MIIYLSEEHKSHLEMLHGLATPVFIDFCKLSWDFLQNGPNVKKYNIAAQKLQVQPSDITNVIHALNFLLIEGCKYNLSESDWKMTLSIAGFSSEHQDIMTKFYNNRKLDLSEGLQKLHDPKPSYQDLNWRLEVEVASQTSENIKPKVTLDLVLKTPKPVEQESADGSAQLANDRLSNVNISHNIAEAKTASECENTIEHVLLECDLPNLLNMTSKLEQALKESKSQHVRKIQRGLQRK